MIVKEMRPIDASLGLTLDAEGCMTVPEQTPPLAPSSWAVMVKAADASHDGWYWCNVDAEGDGNPPILDRSAVTDASFFEPPPKEPNPAWYPTGDLFDQDKPADVVYPYNMFGNYCLNCHAATERESTYSSLENLLTPGIRYKGYEFTAEGAPSPVSGSQHATLTTVADGQAPAYRSPFARPLAKPTAEFLRFYDQLAEVPFARALELRLPAESYDHVVSAAAAPGQFLTSDQCVGCHDATFNSDAIPNMLFADAGTTIDLSPYGEWRASPMGLAGRDTIFFAQLQSETNNLPQFSECIENTCLHCHGVMGQRQLGIDTQGPAGDECKKLFAVPPPPEVAFGKPFRLAMVSQYQQKSDSPHARYGALARDGISCTVCHHIADRHLGREESFTGNFVAGDPKALFGPYEDNTVAVKPMEQALGITPQYGRQISDSDLCGTCHNILLPVFANDGRHLSAKYEQTNHLEWVNSDFARSGETFRSCQDCHMPTHYRTRKGERVELKFKIANSEDDTFAPTTHRLPDAEIELTERERFARHSLHGLNVFLNELFQQFPLLLGIRQIDYMTGTGATPGLITGRNAMLEMARYDTAAITLDSVERTADGQLKAIVTVENRVGHFLPSGAGFRRVFIELLVRDKDGEVLWASGRTDGLGVILDGATGTPLKSEQPIAYPQDYQPHYQRISRQDQVQIYEELLKDSAGDFTTSFLRRVTDVKDNRLRPMGYDPTFFAKSDSPFIRELAHLYGEVAKDPDYTDPKRTGADRIEYLIELDPQALERVDHVQATLYSQSIPPFYLQERFRDAHRGPGNRNEIERLYYLTSRLNTAAPDSHGQPFIEGWKLMITCATAAPNKARAPVCRGDWKDRRLALEKGE